MSASFYQSVRGSIVLQLSPMRCGVDLQ